MDYKELIEQRINERVLEINMYLGYALNNADKRPTLEKAEHIKALSYSLAQLLPYVTEETKDEDTIKGLSRGSNSKNR